MDVLTLIREARAAGLSLSITTDGRLSIRGPKSASELAKSLGEHKDAVVEVLTARRCRRCRSSDYIDFPIHGGRSIRRDCARCGFLIDLPQWYGVSDGVCV